jgi:hypothetical protein
MSHHHHHCCCCAESCPCCHEGDHHHHEHEHEHHEEFAPQLLELADQAWMDLLKEKIKAQIEAANGGQLDQLAKLIAESNNLRWKHKLAGQKVSNSYKEKLSNFFHKD